MKTTLPHTAPVLQRIRPTLERPIEMAMHFMLPFPALVNKSQLEQRAHVRPLARQRDENRDVGGVVLGIFTVGVKVNRPLVAPDGEIVAGDMLADAHSFGHGVALDHEAVRPVYRLGDGARASRRNQQVRGSLRRFQHCSMLRLLLQFRRNA